MGQGIHTAAGPVHCELTRGEGGCWKDHMEWCLCKLLESSESLSK